MYINILEYTYICTYVCEIKKAYCDSLSVGFNIYFYTCIFVYRYINITVYLYMCTRVYIRK
ncbi:hypothetical protein D0503_05110 [Leuconostoc mesenteroides]|nr:hypothetical protein [Leuconostoc mesenteroides]MCT4376963.1 hypothetical protein [Leuconostoc suionicum]MCT8385867.1 hypothetical protein [Leuconostoc mesenteroides]